MIDSEICLSAETLERLSRGDLAPATIREIETHVNDCENCRQLLAVVESDSQWQDEICPVLRTREDVTYRSADGADGADSEHESQTLASVLMLLGPTDDPHMLGRIGAYEIVGVIGRGGMGVVFKAFDGALNRFVAIKMLLPHLAASGAARKRFAREGRAAAAVIDDNVMPIYNVDQWQGTPYLVTQYSRGMTLQQRIQKQGPLEVKEILRIAMQTAKGLDAAHAQGLVHRDIKPSNILLDRTVERAMLTDFGLARAVDDASITRTGTITGTPQYMSPEQARGGKVDARSDLFGLGCVMYAMCTGRPPFRADNSYAILRLIADEDPRPIHEINSDIPIWLSKIISRLMCKQAEDRYANAAEVAELCESCLAHVQQPAAVNLPDLLISLPTRKRISFLGNGMVLMCLALLLVAGGLLAMISEANKATLVIKCSAADVPIRITQDDTVVKKMAVTKDGATIRIAAGKYRIEVDGDHPEFSIENNTIVLSRGGTESVEITLVEDSRYSPVHDAADNQPRAAIVTLPESTDNKVSGSDDLPITQSDHSYSIAPDSALLDPRVTVMENGPVSPLPIKSVQLAGKLQNSVVIERSGYDGLELGCKVQLGQPIRGVLAEAKIISLSKDEAIGKLIEFPPNFADQASSLSACDPDIESPFNEEKGNSKVLVDLRLSKSRGDTVFKSRQLVQRLLEIGGQNIRIAIWPQGTPSSFSVFSNTSGGIETPTSQAVSTYLREQKEISFLENRSFYLAVDPSGKRIVSIMVTHGFEVHRAYLSNDQSVDSIGFRSVTWKNSEGELTGLNVNMRERPLLGTADIVSAELVPTSGNLSGNYSVEIRLTPEAAQRFAERTKTLIDDNPKVHLSVFADDTFHFAARLISPVPGGRLLISGHFSKQEAQELVDDFHEETYLQNHPQIIPFEKGKSIQQWLKTKSGSSSSKWDDFVATLPASAFDSPNVTFQRYSRMVEQRNWKEVLACLTEDCRDEETLERLVFIHLLSLYATPTDEQVKSNTNPTRFRSVGFLKELEQQFPGFTKTNASKDPIVRKLQEELKSLDPAERRQARLSLVRMHESTDRDKLFTSLIDFISRLDGSDLHGPQKSKLVDIDVRGDDASAIVVSEDNTDRKPVAFKKTTSGWKLDNLNDDSVIDHMAERHREVEGINAMLIDSIAQEYRAAGVAEEEINAMRKSVLLQMQKAESSAESSAPKLQTDPATEN